MKQPIDDFMASAMSLHSLLAPFYGTADYLAKTSVSQIIAYLKLMILLFHIYLKCAFNMSNDDIFYL